MAAPVVASVGAQGYSTTGTLALPVASGVASGSLVVVGLFSYWNGTTSHTTADITPPSGFTAAGSAGSTLFGSLYGLLSYWYKYATGADSGTYTFTSSSAGFGGYSTRITGISSGNPFVDSFHSALTTVSSTATVATFTPAANDSLLLAFTYGGGSFTYPSGWTIDAQATDSDSDQLGIGHIAQTTAAATGSLAFVSGSGYSASLVGTLRGSAPPAGGVSISLADTVATAGSLTPNTSHIAGISSNKRYFVDQSGNPFLVRGDSPWNIIQQLTPTDWDTYLASRRSQGKNVLMVGLIATNGSGGTYSLADVNGNLPFTGGDISSPNENYWTRVDAFLAKARDAGFSMFINPFDYYALRDMNTSATASQFTAYGSFLASRYPEASYPGWVWYLGNDYDYVGHNRDTLYGAFYTAVQGAGNTRPWTILLDYMQSYSTDSSYWEQRVTVDSVYTYWVTYQGMLTSYFRNSTVRDPRPAIFAEGSYENASSNPSNRALRKQIAWTLTSGGAGFLLGNDKLWNFVTGWQSYLSSTVSTQLARLGDAVQNIPWWKVVPDITTPFVTSSRGTRITADNKGESASGTSNDGNDYVAAAVSADGTTAVVYLPTSQAITIDTTLLGPSPTAYRVDPTTGAKTTFSVTSSISAPGNNASGDSDWLYVFSASPIASSSTTISETDTFTVVGSVGKFATAAVNETATLTQSGVVGRVAGATLAETFAAAVAGRVDAVGDTQVNLTVSISSSGTVAPSGNGAATLAETVTISAAGNVAGSLTVSLPEVVSVTAVGTVTRAGQGTALAEAVDVQAGGYVIHPGGLPLALTGSITASGAVVTNNPDLGIALVSTIVADGLITRMPVFLFRTPTKTVRNASGDSLFGKMSIEVGITVYRLNGAYSQTSDPTPELLGQCDEVYLGGHDCIIDQDTADRLTNAGYGPFIEQVGGGES